MSTIFEPADLIINLLFVPKLIYFCAFFAYDGLRNGVTLTHAGIGKGSIARIYTFLYLLVCIFQLMIIPSLLRELLAIDPQDLKQALTLSLSSPGTGLIFLGLAVFLFFMRERLITSSTNYFSPFTSPRAVKKLMSTSINENEQPQKSTSPV